MVPARPTPTPASEDDSPWLNSQQAAAMLGVQRASLYAYVSRGLLRAHSHPGSRGHVYARIDVQRLARQRQTVRNPAQLARSTLDWGTPVLRSAITQVSQGQLYYRGRDALQWAQHASLEDTAALLLGQPIAAEPHSARKASTTAATAQPLPQPRPPDQVLRAWHSLPGNEPNLAHLDWPQPLLQQMLGVLTGLPSIDETQPTAEQFIHQQLSALWQVDAVGENTLRQALVLCADHELNASSFAARVVASTGASLHASLGAGLAALSGPLHGGMTAVIDQHWDDWHAAPQAGGSLPPSLAQLLADTRINGSPHYCAGFGHPLYPAGDPRSQRLLSLLPADAQRHALLAAVQRHTGLHPSLDYALVAIQRGLGLPAGAAFVLFALGRTAGWLAHALEQRDSGQLIRPRAQYVGLPAETASQAEAPAAGDNTASNIPRRIIRF
ncbi:citrate synthase family protein [Comamonas sp. JUb58]|uniref:citrate synthase family protein n=1 Tax=Comamonas sp. JUb58 TaxID=2485114 RepID=UPI00105B4491|nr:citrate synthase family protein [Comamonas sp. JUb58]TDS83593.1 citrate synthase [Comamonas sp. JUb58]